MVKNRIGDRVKGLSGGWIWGFYMDDRGYICVAIYYQKYKIVKFVYVYIEVDGGCIL